MDEPLNIISDSYIRNFIGGPNKVIINTVKGLTKIGYPFEINKDIRQYRKNWIHDSVAGLIEVGLLRLPAVVGPNLAVLPGDLPRFRPDLSNCIYLQPSPWCVELWEEMGFSECSMQSWPVGIDTEYFGVKEQFTSSKEVMIYFKRRDPLLLNQAIGLVNKRGLNPKVIKYGEYDEDQYKQILSKAKFGIWIGISESQGVALQEALASGLPMIVCNVNSLFESEIDDYRFPEKLRSFKPTSAPYFDKRCGIIISDFSKLDEAINEISDNLSSYNPREYVIENLSLEKQAIKLLSYFDILKQQKPEYFKQTAPEIKQENFTLSFRGRIINRIFILRRKTNNILKRINI